jgi:hypothetical protein
LMLIEINFERDCLLTQFLSKSDDLTIKKYI